MQQGSFMNIRKRYSEFDEFRERLVTSFPNSEAAVPPLPPKSVISKFRPRFLERRRAGLQYFLKCATHRRFLYNSSADLFLAQLYSPKPRVLWVAGAQRVPLRVNIAQLGCIPASPSLPDWTSCRAQAAWVLSGLPLYTLTFTRYRTYHTYIHAHAAAWTYSNLPGQSRGGKGYDYNEIMIMPWMTHICGSSSTLIADLVKRPAPTASLREVGRSRDSDLANESPATTAPQPQLCASPTSASARHSQRLSPTPAHAECSPQNSNRIQAMSLVCVVRHFGAGSPIT